MPWTLEELREIATMLREAKKLGEPPYDSDVVTPIKDVAEEDEKE